MKFDIYKLADKYKLTETEVQVLRYILDNHEQSMNMAVRDVANLNYTSAATVIKLSKKMGYTGYIDMVYRLNFMIKNRQMDQNHTSDLTSFMNNIPSDCLEHFIEQIRVHRNHLILVSATGFSTPLAEYIERKLLVTGFRCIKTNAYEVYDSNKLGASLMIAVSRSGETDTIVRVADSAHENQMDIISFTGEQMNHIAGISTVNIPILDDKALDDRNLQANYFYARVIIVFEHLMDRASMNMAVRDVANLNYTSAATVIKLSKKMGYTGYIDMVYRLNFMIKNRQMDQNHTSDLTSFMNNIPSDCLEHFIEQIRVHRNHLILVSATGFSTPLAEYIERKLLVTGFRCIKTNAYEVYDSNKLGASLMIAVSRSGETDTIVRVADSAHENQMDIISFTGEQMNHIAGISTVNIPILDDKALDDRNLQANYFYARVIIVFEHLMDRALEQLEKPEKLDKLEKPENG